VIWNIEEDGEEGGGGTAREGGLGLLEDAPGVVNGRARGCECGEGVDSVDEWPE
jgi:hypothetical protein